MKTRRSTPPAHPELEDEMSSPVGDRASRDELRRLVGGWAPYGRRPQDARPAALALSGFWVLGGVLVGAFSLAAGLHGVRLADGLGSAAVAVLVGLAILGAWRSAPLAFPWTAMHLTFLSTIFALFVGADAAHASSVVVALLALSALVGVVVGSLIPPAWAVVYLGALSAGISTVTVRRGIDVLVIPLLVAPAAGSALVAVVLAARARSRLLVDPVTELPNRAALELVVAHQIALAGRSAQPFTVVLIDIGEMLDRRARSWSEADEVVRKVVVGWLALLRATDVLARFGPGEFVFMLPNCGLTGIEAVLRRALKVTDDLGSAGATGYVPGDSFDSLVARARDSMLEARSLTRGEVLVRSSLGAVIANHPSG